MIAGESITVRVEIGDQLTVTPAGGGTTQVIPLTDAGVPGAPVAITAATTYGPFGTHQIYRLTVVSGSMTYARAHVGLDVFQVLNSILYGPGGTRVLSNAGVPTDGTSGTGAGVAGKGSICLDVTNGKAYLNGNTTASPTWKLVTSAA